MRFLRKLLKYVPAFLLLAGLIAALAFWPEGPPQGEGGAANYTCSMHPQIRLPKGQKCPLCGMDLVPVEQLAGLQAQLEARAGVQTEAVKFRKLFKELRTVGRFDYNESQVAYITARIAGRVVRVYADFTGIKVKKNDHLVDLYSPELVIAQDELLRAVKASAAGPGATPGYAQAMLEAARTKLLLLGILPEQVQAIEKSGKPTTHLTIFAPLGGTVIDKNVRAEQYVKEGDVLYRIANLDPIWLYLDVYEYDLQWVRFGQTVDVSVEAYPGHAFPGTITFIDPFLNDKTRSVKVRVNLKNPDGKLKPAMYASALIKVGVRADGTPEPTGLEGKYICPMHPEVVRDKAGQCDICEMQLELVPGLKPVKADPHAGHNHAPKNGAAPPPGQVLAIRASAVLDTGKRQVAYRLNDDGTYELVELTLGPRTVGNNDDGKPAVYYPVLKGLKVGEYVVVQGGFLLDSQRQIEGMPSLLNLGGGHAAPAGGHKH